MLGWGWNGFRTHCRDCLRQAEDYPMTTPGPVRAGVAT